MKALILETDQTECYDESGRKIACEGSGQDAELRVLSRIGERFQIDGDVVFDDWTGLTWTRSANLAEFPLEWESAVQFTEELSQSKTSGRSGWRLPTRRELFSLVSHQAINPALPVHHPFIDVFSGYYWTGDSSARLMNQAWYIHLGGARVFRGMKHGSYMVWPVAPSASGSQAPIPRFVSYDEAVYDRLTSLIWLRDADVLARATTWQEAIHAVVQLNRRQAAGFHDWHLPNIRELETLVDISTHSPALGQDHPFTSVQEGYWSSTTSTYEPRYAWVLYLRDGAVGVGFKSNPEFHVWAVRKRRQP